MDEGCFLFFYGREGQKSEYSSWYWGKSFFGRKKCEFAQYTQNTIMSQVELKCLSGFAKRYLPKLPIDLHPFKPLISLVPINCTTYCFQGQGPLLCHHPYRFPSQSQNVLGIGAGRNERQMKVFSQGLKPQLYCQKHAENCSRRKRQNFAMKSLTTFVKHTKYDLSVTHSKMPDETDLVIHPL